MAQPMTVRRSSRLAVSLAAAGMLVAGCSDAAAPSSGSSPGGLADDAVSPPGPIGRLQPCPSLTAGTRTELPAVTLRCLGPGPAQALSRLPARPYVVNLWASWCRPCYQESPRLRAAARAANGRVGFLGVDTADKHSSALAFLNEFDLSYPQLSDPNGDALHRIGAPGLPVTLAVDADGRIVYRRIGEISAAQLAAAVRAADPSAGVPPARTP